MKKIPLFFKKITQNYSKLFLIVFALLLFFSSKLLVNDTFASGKNCHCVCDARGRDCSWMGPDCGYYQGRLCEAGDVFGESIFGTIQPPAGVREIQEEVGAGNIGIILFASNLVRLVTVAAGIWVMFNFISAGWIYITSGGDASAHEKVSEKITQSLIGLAIVALAYTIAGLIGLLIFGDASFILRPTLTGVGQF